MPKNIADAYKNALNNNLNSDFEKVISFCEKDEVCRDDNSLKKNVLMFWSYKKIAVFYEKGNKYKKAYEFWQKTLEFAGKSSTKINIAYKLLALLPKMRLSINDKAQEIVRICNYLQKEYENTGNSNNTLRISKLREKALKLLNKSKYLH